MPNLRLNDYRLAVIHSAENWPSRRAVTATQPDEHMRYRKATALLMKDIDILDTTTKTDTRLTYDQAEFGARVLFRLGYIGAVLGRHEGIDVDELQGIMNGPSTIDTIHSFMLVSNPVATRVEEQTGIIPTAEPISHLALEGWSLTESGMVREDVDDVIDDVKRKLSVSRMDGECPIHKVQFTSSVLTAIMTICARDDNLFKRSLAA